MVVEIDNATLPVGMTRLRVRILEHLNCARKNLNMKSDF